MTTINGTNIVSMATAQKDIRVSVVNEVQAYWEGLRQGRPVPLRSAVDPRGIERALEYAFILERVAPSIARFRLAGMHLNDLMGMEVRGMPLTSFFTPAGRTKVSEILESVFQGPCVVELTLRAEESIGKPPMEAKLLILPLKSDLGDITRALGCLVGDGAIGRTPRRFEVVSVKTTEIIAGRPADLGDSVPATGVSPVLASQSEVAEPRAPFIRADEKAADRPRGAHLRLVKTDS